MTLLKKASSASFLYLYLELDDSNHLSAKICDRRGDFKIINFPVLCNNISASPACAVYISLRAKATIKTSYYVSFAWDTGFCTKVIKMRLIRCWFFLYPDFIETYYVILLFSSWTWRVFRTWFKTYLDCWTCISIIYNSLYFHIFVVHILYCFLPFSNFDWWQFYEARLYCNIHLYRNKLNVMKRML